MRKGLILFAASVMSLCAANIVNNPGFETGSFAPWVTNTIADHPWSVAGSNPFEGTNYASTGCVGAQCITDDTGATNPVGAWLYQDLATTPGTFYTLSFEFASAGQPGQELQVLWGGSSVLDLVNLNSGPYILYTVGNLQATSETTRLAFLGRQDPSYDGLDAVCVSSDGTCGTSAVPEPATLSITAAGLCAAALLAFRRRLLRNR